MSISRRKAASFLLLAVAASAGRTAEQANSTLEQQTPKQLSVTDFEKLHQRLLNMSTQRVWSIPWELSVREARELAAKQRKPVFLWISSNGGTHPLGPC